MRKLILTPTYNEKENIKILIKDIFKYADKDTYLRVIDDNSPDGTQNSVKELQKKYKRLELQTRKGKLGFASAYLDQIKKERKSRKYDAIITMDADLSHKPRYLPNFFRLLETNDLVIGSRYILGGKIKNWSFKRRILSRYGNMYVRIIYFLPIKDCSTGFMGFRADALKDIYLDKLQSEGYSFLSEFKYHFYLAKKRIKETPIIFEERTLGSSKISGNIIYEGLLLPLKLRNKIRKIYKKKN